MIDKNINCFRDFSTPPVHVNFLAKKLFGECGHILDGAIAYIEPHGGGPIEQHTHEKNHLFVVVRGEVKVLYGERVEIYRANESFLVKGDMPHSIWNNTEETVIMLGISLKKED